MPRPASDGQGAAAVPDRHALALEGLQSALGSAGDAETRDLLRRSMIAIFTELGPQSELAGEHRRRLAAALN
ncbi:MAG TPA: tetratricopeptide repeat protein [Thermoleophilaceae bacterium]|nr:tetratricopeptide repeat protein [Thermoleophilaceae bacterium]